MFSLSLEFWLLLLTELILRIRIAYPWQRRLKLFNLEKGLGILIFLFSHLFQQQLRVQLIKQGDISLPTIFDC